LVDLRDLELKYGVKIQAEGLFLRGRYRRFFRGCRLDVCLALPDRTRIIDIGIMLGIYRALDRLFYKVAGA